MSTKPGRRWQLLAASLAGQVLAYWLWRPTMLRWGTEGAEAVEPLPGDDLKPLPAFQSTRAITIDAPPESVWPWIVQMGIYRAGFYTHDWLERAMFRARYVEGKHSATRIHPDLQDLKVGDQVPYGGGVCATVTGLEPNRHLVAGEQFILRPLTGNRTRFIIRYRGAGYLSAAAQGAAPDAPAVTRALASTLQKVPGALLLACAVDLFIGDPLHHFMEVGVLRGVKRRAESSYGSATAGGTSQTRGARGHGLMSPLVLVNACPSFRRAYWRGKYWSEVADVTGWSGSAYSTAGSRPRASASRSSVPAGTLTRCAPVLPMPEP